MGTLSTVIAISALLLGIGAVNMGLGLQASLLGIRAGVEGFPVAVIGLVMSSYYIGFMSGSFFGPALVNRVGHIRTFSAVASLASAAALLHAVILTPVSWIALRVITGFCFASASMVAESWLNDRASNQNRGTLLGVYMLVILGATAAGQLLLNLAPPSGYDLFILVSVVISVALVPVALTSTPMPAQIEVPRMPLLRLYRISPVGVVAAIGGGMVVGGFWGMGAVFAHDIGLPMVEISLFMTLLVGGGALTQVPIGRLSDRMDRRLVIAALCLGIILVSSLMATGFGGKSGWLLALAAVLGGLMLPLYGLALSHANDHLDTADFVPAASAMLMLYGLGAMAGPTIASTAMQIVGPHGLFGFAAVIGLVLGGFTIARRLISDPVPVEEQGEFVPAPRTTAVAYEMAPAAQEYPEEEEAAHGEAQPPF